MLLRRRLSRKPFLGAGGSSVHRFSCWASPSRTSAGTLGCLSRGRTVQDVTPSPRPTSKSWPTEGLKNRVNRFTQHPDGVETRIRSTEWTTAHETHRKVNTRAIVNRQAPLHRRGPAFVALRRSSRSRKTRRTGCTSATPIKSRSSRGSAASSKSCSRPSPSLRM